MASFLEDTTLRVTLQKIVDTAVGESVTPGCAIGILECNAVTGCTEYFFESGKSAYSPSSTLVSEATYYDLASVTKLITALTLVTYIETNEVGLDAMVGVFLDENKSFPLSWIHTTTVRDVLEYRVDIDIPSTHALAQKYFIQSDTKFLEALFTAPCKSAHKNIGRYSNVPAVVMAKIIERVSGKKFNTAVREKILNPIGVGLDVAFLAEIRDVIIAPTGTSAEVSVQVHDGTERQAESIGRYTGIAGLFATNRGLLQIGRALLTNTLQGGGDLIQKNLYELITHEQRARSEFCGSTLGLQSHSRLFGDTESSRHLVGFSGFTGTMIALDVVRHYCVVTLTNRTYPGPTVSTASGESVSTWEKETRELCAVKIQIPVLTAVEEAYLRYNVAHD